MQENNTLETFDLIIEPGRPIKGYLEDLWRFRDLFFFLAWRDFRVRYRQTLIGSAWALVRPFLTMVVFTIIFGILAKMPSGGVPYPVLVFAGLLPWQFFSAIFSSGTTSLVSNANLLTKIYFPRLIVVFTGVLVSLVDFFITLVMLLVLMVWYGVMPGWSFLFFPVFLLLAMISASGFGIWLAVLSVRYRDFIQISPFVLQLFQYISPVGFASSVVPEDWRFWYSLNPIVGIIDGFRWSILGGESQLYWPGLVVSFFISLVVLVSGVLYFRRVERTFADYI